MFLSPYMTGLQASISVLIEQCCEELNVHMGFTIILIVLVLILNTCFKCVSKAVENLNKIPL